MEFKWGQILQLSGPLLPTDIVLALRAPFDEYVGTWQDVLDLVKTDGGLTTADIPDTVDKRYVTDADLLILADTSGTNTGDETTDSIKFKLGAASGSSDGYLTQTDWNTFNGKQAEITAGTTSQYYRGDKTFQTLDKAAVGLGNVDNTSDVNKPVSTAQAAADAAIGATWTDYSGTSTFTGWSSRSVTILQYNIVGKIMFVQFKIVGVTTTGNNTASFTLPTAAASWVDIDAAIKTITATTTAAGNANIAASSSTVNLHPTQANGNWQSAAGVVKTASGTIIIPLP